MNVFESKIPAITALDFETTGLKEPGAVSLALIRQELSRNRIIYAKYFLINPEKEIEYGAYKVHGISEKMVKDQPNFAEIWKEIEPDISGQIIVAHNAKYDAGVLTYNIQRYGLHCEPFYTICTCDNARKLIDSSKVPNYKLDSVCDYFGITLENHHDARDDANACRKIFNRLGRMGELDITKISI
jgi:DNA polymerase-3 subunit epsilon